jgi:hypothetical protein
MRRISKLPAGLFGATGAVYEITVARDELAAGFKAALDQLGRPKAPASKK